MHSLRQSAIEHTPAIIFMHHMRAASEQTHAWSLCAFGNPTATATAQHSRNAFHVTFTVCASWPEGRQADKQHRLYRVRAYAFSTQARHSNMHSAHRPATATCIEHTGPPQQHAFSTQGRHSNMHSAHRPATVTCSMTAAIHHQSGGEPLPAGRM